MEDIEKRMIEEYKNNDHDEYLSYIVNGLNIDYDKKTICFSDDDFSSIKKIHNQHIDLTVVSLFEQQAVDSTELNPVICGLKEKYGWKFDITDEQIAECINKAKSKFSCLNKKFDTFVSVHPRTPLIKRFTDICVSQISCNESMARFFIDMSFDYEDLCMLIDWDALNEKYGRETAIKIENEMLHKLYEQSKKRKYFNAKDFPRNYLKYLYCCRGANENGKDFVSLIADKDILLFLDSYTDNSILLDDAITINRNFCPKSITAIRVF